MEEHGVAGIDGARVTREGRFGVVGRDHLTRRHPLDAAHGRDVEQVPARHDLREGLDAVAGRAPLHGHVLHAVTAVHPTRAVQMVQAVHVRSHLRRRVHVFDDPVDLVTSDRAGRVRGEQLAEGAAGERRHVLVEDVREVEDPAFANEPGGPDNASGAQALQRPRFRYPLRVDDAHSELQVPRKSL